MTGRAAALIVAIGLVLAVSIYFARHTFLKIELEEKYSEEIGQRTRSLEREDDKLCLYFCSTEILIITLVILLCRNAIREKRRGETDSYSQFSILSMLALVLALSLICSAITIPVPWDAVKHKPGYNIPWFMSKQFVETRVKEIANTRWEYDVVFIERPSPNICKLEDGSYVVVACFSIRWKDYDKETTHKYTCHLVDGGSNPWECKSLNISDTELIEPP
jgi:hypothetical protein